MLSMHTCERMYAVVYTAYKHACWHMHRWFSKKEDDYQIERDLFPSGAPDLNIDWQISVKTSDISGAGTDANVFCVLMGEQGGAGGKHVRSAHHGRCGPLTLLGNYCSLQQIISSLQVHNRRVQLSDLHS